MLRRILESYIGKIPDEQFKVIMGMATEDIKFNLVSFRKRTTLNKVLMVSIQSHSIVQKIKKAAFESH